jgi:quercetin dioxygenase-like cupin family protein
MVALVPETPMRARIQLMLSIAALASLIGAAAEAQAPVPTRAALATFSIAPGKLIDRVDTTRVDFQPGQVMPMHMHPVPVICFVASGNFRVRIGDAPERPAPLGSATYEPAGVTVHYFKNASVTEPAELLCAVLAGAADKVTSVMLDTPPPR